MKKFDTPVLNMVLALGVLCILAGLMLFARLASNLNAVILRWAVLMIVFGAVTFYFSLVTFKYAILFFTGLTSCVCGTFFMFAGSTLLSVGIAELWPFSVVLCGICLILTGYAKNRRILMSYSVPSIILIFLGLFFSLFSLNIIKMSLSKFLGYWWPLLLIILGASLVILYLIQQNPVTAQYFPKIQEDIDSEGDLSE